MNTPAMLATATETGSHRGTEAARATMITTASDRAVPARGAVRLPRPRGEVSVPMPWPDRTNGQPGGRGCEPASSRGCQHGYPRPLGP
jgi:hypothetical protein